MAFFTKLNKLRLAGSSQDLMERDPRPGVDMKRHRRPEQEQIQIKKSIYSLRLHMSKLRQHHMSKVTQGWPGRASWSSGSLTSPGERTYYVDLTTQEGRQPRGAPPARP